MLIFRGGVLAGAIGISGDGIDQDDMVVFFGLANGGLVFGIGIGNVLLVRRVDQIIGLFGGQLCYVSCLIVSFLDIIVINVCDGI